MIERQIEKKIREKIGLGKAIIIMGARQIGKTTLLKQIFSDNALWLNGDEQEVRSLFAATFRQHFIQRHLEIRQYPEKRQVA
jgi:predicted AAA+ superfamily ATPase